MIKYFLRLFPWVREPEPTDDMCFCWVTNCDKCRKLGEPVILTLQEQVTVLVERIEELERQLTIWRDHALYLGQQLQGQDEGEG